MDYTVAAGRTREAGTAALEREKAAVGYQHHAFHYSPDQLRTLFAAYIGLGLVQYKTFVSKCGRRFEYLILYTYVHKDRLRMYARHIVGGHKCAFLRIVGLEVGRALLSSDWGGLDETR